MKALLINTDGSRQMVEITGNTMRDQNKCIWEILGGYFETVGLDGMALMLIDEEGLLKKLPHNPVASEYAGVPIVGTALIVGLYPNEDGELEFADVPEWYKENA